MVGTKCILHYLLKKPTNGQVQVCADAATAEAQHSPSPSERMMTFAGNTWLPFNNEAIRGLSEKVLESYFT